ncbi:MAG: cytochrome c maturation protein CcmE [Gammaproteobacteria bacterium]
MNPKRRKKLIFILSLIVGLSISLCLALYALSKNINFYYTPSQIISGEAPQTVSIRVGGLVKKNSIIHEKNLLTKFVLRDQHQEINIYYTGVLPDLFREEQGIVTEGKLINRNTLQATQVLAKHSADYKPKSKNL